MDFMQVKDEAEECVRKSSCDLSIVMVDEENNEIHFLFKENNFPFYISCPSSESTSWNVWSNDENSQQVLQYVMDSCDFDSHKNITTLLNALTKSLKSASDMKAYKSSHSRSANEEDENDAEEEDDDDDEAEDDFDNYYADEDFDAQDQTQTKDLEEKHAEEKLAASFYQMGGGTEMAVKRLVKDFKSLRSETSKFGIVANPVGNNLFIWEVKLTDIPQESQLGKDLLEYAKRYRKEPFVTLEMQFPPDYPFSPPFVRVLSPRFKFLTGHVTLGGSICMQMLTKSGWRPTNDIESILIQVRTEILSDPQASLDLSKGMREYTESEAKTAFDRMVAKYGWS